MPSAVDAGFDTRPPTRKAAPRGVLLDIAPPPDHSDQRIDPDARESHSKPRERPKFSSPHLTCFALARARSGPDARDEGLNSNGSVAVSENARLAANRKATQNEAFPTSYVKSG